MNRRFHRSRCFAFGLAAAVVVLGAPLAVRTRANPMAAPRLQPVSVPAAPGSGMHSLTEADDGHVYLSWIEEEGAGHALKFSSLRDGSWTPPQTVTRGDDWFVNWADRPSVAALPGGALVAHWLVNAPDKVQSDYTYGIQIAYSSSHGRDWRTIHQPGHDNREKSQYTGFLSFLGVRESLLAAYLSPPAAEDRRPTDDETHRMTLRLASFEPHGTLRSDTVLDADVCSCCPLNTAQIRDGAVIVYRDRWPGEIRDISIVRNVDGQWTEPRPVHRDGWEYNGCPTNGPDVAAAGQRVAVSWFTAAGDVPEVRLAFSDDGGASFGPPLRVNEDRPVGYPAVVLLDDGGAVVSWLGYGLGDQTRVQLRHVSSEGELGAVVVVAETAEGRSTGMPQLARAGGDLLLVWRSDEQIRSALVRLQDVQNIPRERS